MGRAMSAPSCPARSDPRRLAGLLGVFRWPRGVGKARGALARRELEQGIERLQRRGHPCPRIAPFGKATRHGLDGQVLGVDGIDLVPTKRRGDLAAASGTGAPGSEERLVRSVLVEVDEDPSAAFLLPPLRRDEVRVTTLELPSERKRCRANLRGGPSPLEADADMQAASSGRLGESGQG